MEAPFQPFQLMLVNRKMFLFHDPTPLWKCLNFTHLATVTVILDNTWTTAMILLKMFTSAEYAVKLTPA